MSNSKEQTLTLIVRVELKTTSRGFWNQVANLLKNQEEEKKLVLIDQNGSIYNYPSEGEMAPVKAAAEVLQKLEPREKGNIIPGKELVFTADAKQQLKRIA